MQHYKYNLGWASEVYRCFVQACPRATEKCLKLAQASDDDVIRLLASGSHDWETFKRAVKTCKGYANCDAMNYAQAEFLHAMASAKARHEVNSLLDE